MTASEQTRKFTRRIDVWIGVAPMVIAILAIAFSTPAQAQTYNVLHDFTGPDGAYPYGTLTMDRAGNFYGTTYGGGSGCNGYGCGTVFKLTHKNSGWILTPLYKFQAGNDGGFPTAGVTIGPDGTLYGTTAYGGGGPCSQGGAPTAGCGIVFNLKPPASACTVVLCPWTETVLHRFTGGSDGAYPGFGNLVFDQAGSLYGTTEGDEFTNQATAFKLTHSNGGWTESLVYNFGDVFVGSGMIFDGVGNLYGTTGDGGKGYGSIYELAPSGSGWTETTLYVFQDKDDGYDPLGGVTFDQEGNLYGTTFNDGGRVYQLKPSNGSWIFSTLHYFGGYEGSYSGPTVDAAGNVYGTLSVPGTAFELVRSTGWLENSLYSFPGKPIPVGGVVVDANGNIYGTTSLGGTEGCSGGSGCGVIFE